MSSDTSLVRGAAAEPSRDETVRGRTCVRHEIIGGGGGGGGEKPPPDSDRELARLSWSTGDVRRHRALDHYLGGTTPASVFDRIRRSFRRSRLPVASDVLARLGVSAALAKMLMRIQETGEPSAADHRMAIGCWRIAIGDIERRTRRVAPSAFYRHYRCALEVGAAVTVQNCDRVHERLGTLASPTDAVDFAYFARHLAVAACATVRARLNRAEPLGDARRTLRPLYNALAICRWTLGDFSPQVEDILALWRYILNRLSATTMDAPRRWRCDVFFSDWVARCVQRRRRPNNAHGLERLAQEFGRVTLATTEVAMVETGAATLTTRKAHEAVGRLAWRNLWREIAAQSRKNAVVRGQNGGAGGGGGGGGGDVAVRPVGKSRSGDGNGAAAAADDIYLSDAEHAWIDALTKNVRVGLWFARSAAAVLRALRRAVRAAESRHIHLLGVLAGTVDAMRVQRISVGLYHSSMRFRDLHRTLGCLCVRTRRWRDAVSHLRLSLRGYHTGASIGDTTPRTLLWPPDAPVAKNDPENGLQQHVTNLIDVIGGATISPSTTGRTESRTANRNDGDGGSDGDGESFTAAERLLNIEELLRMAEVVVHLIDALYALGDYRAVSDMSYCASRLADCVGRHQSGVKAAEAAARSPPTPAEMCVRLRHEIWAHRLSAYALAVVRLCGHRRHALAYPDTVENADGLLRVFDRPAVEIGDGGDGCVGSGCGDGARFSTQAADHACLATSPVMAAMRRVCAVIKARRATATPPGRVP